MSPALAPLQVAAGVLALGGPRPGSERGEEFGKTSPIALVIILLLGIATALLIRSMTKRLRNLPDSFDGPRADDARPDDDPRPDDRPRPGGFPQRGPGGGVASRGAGRPSGPDG